MLSQVLGPRPRAGWEEKKEGTCLVQATYPRRPAFEAADEVRGDARLTLSIFIVYVVETVSAFSRDAAPVIFSSASIASLYPLVSSKLGHGHLPTATTAARPDVLLEDPRLSLSIVVPMGTSTGETSPSIRDAGKRRNVVGAVAAVPIYLSFVIFAAAACEVIGGEINRRC